MCQSSEFQLEQIWQFFCVWSILKECSRSVFSLKVVHTKNDNYSDDYDDSYISVLTNEQ